MEITNKNQLDNVKQKNNVYTSEIQSIDFETGEVKEQTITNTTKSSQEPNYIKVYIDTLCAFKGLSKSISPVLIEFCHYMTWANDDRNKQIIVMNKYIKEQVAERTGIKIDRVNKILADIVKSQIFMKMPNQRGVYIVNPYIIARGDWKAVKSLRANFDFTEGNFTLKVEKEITEEE